MGVIGPKLVESKLTSKRMTQQMISGYRGMLGVPTKSKVYVSCGAKRNEQKAER